ncbi:MAG: hypothetical protein KDI13_09635 [Alphaproteobacteria bacterium]|nr:hypothetical protein [Alphaproteobacteria bacterium]
MTLNAKAGMLNKNFFISVGLCSFFLAGGARGALAQASDVCNPPYEAVTTLFYPDLGSYNLWDTVYGEGARSEVFRSVVLAADDEVLAAGEVRSNPEMGARLILVKLDLRGRAVWEKYQAISGLQQVIKILSYGEGYVVLANVLGADGKGGLWLGFLNAQGELQDEKVIWHKALGLKAADIAVRPDGQGMAVVASAEMRVGVDAKAPLERQAYVYLLDAKGNVVRDRSYVPGGSNEILGISALPADPQDGSGAGYAVAGYFVNDAGKKMGWTARLDLDGALVWQRQYSRGLGLQAQKIVPYLGRYMLVFGDVLPADGGRAGSWLGLLDALSGEVRWERFFRGRGADHDYFARDLYVRSDRLISLMMMVQVVPQPEVDDAPGDAEGQESAFENEALPENMSYVHVLTLTPRGDIIGGDAYFHGQKVEAYQMVEGAYGARLITGYSDVPYNEMVERHPFVAEDGDVMAYDSAAAPEEDVVATVDLGAGEAEGDGSGIAMLAKTLDAEKAAAEDVDSSSVEEEDTAPEDVSDLPAITRNGWVVAGEGPKPYKDPCIVKPVELP